MEINQDSATISTESQSTFSEKIAGCIKNITIEPIIVLHNLSRGIANITLSHLILEKACRVNLALEEDICNALSSRNESYPQYKMYEQHVQSLAASMFIWKDVITSIFPCLLLLFIGSWSDRYNKRMPMILNSVLSEIVSVSMYLICTYFFYELPLEVNLLSEALPQAITGGFMVGQVGVMSYISDTTTEKNRTARMSTFQFAVSTTLCISVFLSGILYEQIKFYGVFGLTLIILIVAFLYGKFFVKDIWEYEAKKGVVYTRSKHFLKDFFNFENVSKTFKVVLHKRERSGRTKIWLLLILALLLFGPFRGEANISYYYVRYKFGWGPVKYSMFNTFELIMFVTGNLISLVLFIKIIKLHDSLIGIISCVSKILRCLLFAFGPSSTYLYVGAVLNIFHDVSFICLRSLATKYVTRDELGRLFSIFILFETFSPVIYCSLYNKIYAVTLNMFPGTFYIASILSECPGLFIFGWLYFQNRKEEKQSSKNKPNEQVLLT